jgi:hypothetical protein
VIFGAGLVTKAGSHASPHKEDRSELSSKCVFFSQFIAILITLLIETTSC